MEVQIKMPDLATTGSDIRVLRWLVQPGQRVARGQPLVEVETEKAVSPVESIAAGTLKEIRAQPNATVPVGQVIAVLELLEVTAHAPAPNPVRPTPRLGSALAGVVARYKRGFLLALYERMVLIREFEDRVKLLFLEGTMPGTIHQCQGQEATAVGVCAALKADDWITSTFRGHGHALAKGLSPQELLDELFGAETGCCKGRGGSMHVGNMSKGMVPGIAIVGGGIPLATGMGLAFKMQTTRQVVACFFGDGAVSEGAFHEGVNMAALWKLPVVFVCENNLYGASTHVSKVMKNTRISDRAATYGFRGETVDGNDVLAVLEATRLAVAECRAGNGPVLLELLTYRLTGHSRRDPCHYQAAEEREAWKKRDPIERFGAWLIERAGLNVDELTQVRTRVDELMEGTIQKARMAPMPRAEEISSGMFAPESTGATP
jgi:TPP-dependent pyruvate/acetoin dehydrogenase alpha subunit